jgi:hypothetical protein
MSSANEDAERASQWISYWKDIFGSNPDAVENAESSFCPPEPSADEQPADDDAGFAASCRADVVSMAKGPVVWEGQLLTYSPKWGLVWRADFWERDRNNQDFPSRVACWKHENGESGMTLSGCQYSKLELKS